MTGSISYTYFAKDVYKILNAEVKRTLNANSLVTYTASSNILLNSNLINSKEQLKNYNELFNNNKYNEIIIKYIEYVLKFNFQKNKEVISSLYGLVLTTTLNKNIHNFIITQTEGDFLKVREMKLLIDLYMIEKREKINPRLVKLYPLVFYDFKENIQVKTIINRVFEDVYKKPISNEYYNLIKKFKFSLKHINYDKRGYKLIIYNLLSKINSNFNYKSYSVNLRNKVNYINFNHHSYMNGKKICSYSYFDIYNNSIKEVNDLINSINDVLNNPIKIKDLKKRLNLSNK